MGDPVEGCIWDQEVPGGFERLARGRAMRDIEHATVRDDQDALARMALGEALRASTIRSEKASRLSPRRESGMRVRGP